MPMNYEHTMEISWFYLCNLWHWHIFLYIFCEVSVKWNNYRGCYFTNRFDDFVPPW